MTALLQHAPAPIATASAYALQQRLQYLFHAQAREILSRLTLDKIKAGVQYDMSHWNQPMTDATRSQILRQWQTGMLTTTRKIDAALHQRATETQPLPVVRSLRNVISKAGQRRSLFGQLMWDLVNPRVLDAVEELTLNFCRSTNRTATDKLNVAIKRTRAALKEGLAEGQAYLTVRKEIVTIFAEPMRAEMIARTEMNRATGAGGLQQAKDSGVASGLRWLSHQFACERCQKLDGKEVALGEPFWVDPKGGPYAIVLHQPLHTFCLCDTTIVL